MFGSLVFYRFAFFKGAYITTVLASDNQLYFISTSIHISKKSLTCGKPGWEFKAILPSN